MSLINREEAISAIQDIEPFVVLDNKSGNVLGSGINSADVVKKLSTLEPAPQWIPCSERLPEEDGRYLVTCEKWGGWRVDWNIFYVNQHPGWLWEQGVIAWMPLPEPYEVGNNG